MKKHTVNILMIVFLGLGITLGGCGLFDDDNGPSENFSVNTYSPDTQGTISFSLPGADDGAEYTMIAVSHAMQAADNIYSMSKGTVATGEGGGMKPTAQQLQLSKRWSPKALALETKLRMQEKEIVERGLVDKMADYTKDTGYHRTKADGDTCTSDIQCGNMEFCDKDTCRGTLTLNYTDPDTMDVEPVNAVVKRISETSIIVVDEDDDPSADDIDKLGKWFDQISYPRDMAFFGENLDKTYLDRDGNGRIIIFMTSRLNATGTFAGFFNSVDFLSKSQAPDSNERDMFYTVVPDSENPIGLVHATLAHEFQHMINFATRVIQRVLRDQKSAINSALWLNEGLAHLAEDLCGFGDDTQGTVYKYLQDTSSISLAFTNSDGEEDTIEARGMAYLLMRYVFERNGGVAYSGTDGSISDKGGAALLNSFFAGDDTGIDNLNAALGSNYKDTFNNWLIALAMDGTGTTDDAKYNYNELETDSLTGQQHGISLRGTRNISGNSLTFSGPNTSSFFDSEYDGVVRSLGAEYLTLSATNATDVMLEADPLSQVSMIVIRTK